MTRRVAAVALFALGFAALMASVALQNTPNGDLMIIPSAVFFFVGLACIECR